MKNLNNIKYSLEDAEEISQAFQGRKNKSSVRKLRNTDNTVTPQRNKTSKHKRNKRYNDTFNKGNI